MKKRALIILDIILLFILVSCSDENTVRETEAPKPQLTTAESSAIEYLNEFGMNFFKEVSSLQKDENLVVSPLSAAMLLSMLGNVADDTSCKQIYEALGAKDIETINSLANKYTAWLPHSDAYVKLCMANSVWYDDDFTINPEFNKSALEFYSTDFFARDFSNSAGVSDEINKWTSTKTTGLISNIVGHVSKLRPAVLINALYFKSDWAQPFEKENTKKDFFNGRDSRTEVDMMHKKDVELYAETADCQIIRLKFGKGVFELFIILPKPDVSIDSFISSKSLNNYHKLYFTPCNISLALPKFEIKPDKIKISDVFARLGIDNISKAQNYTIFTESTDFDFDIFQKSAVEFNEKGAEAASATWTGSDTYYPMDEKTIKIDHPFIFFINEVSTSVCLFAGRVLNL